MAGTWPEEQLKTQFCISFTALPGTFFELSGSKLATEAGARQLLAVYGARLGALSDAAAATFFMSWFRYVGLGVHCGLSLHNEELLLSLDRLTVLLYENGEKTRVSFKLDTLQLVPFAQQHAEQHVQQNDKQNDKQDYQKDARKRQQERELWRGQVLRRFYREICRPLVEALAAASGVNATMLWGQLPTAYAYFFETWLADDLSEEARERLLADEAALKRFEPEVFGCKKNPFIVKFRMIESLREPGQMMRQKATCCLHYEVEKGSYCYTCPRLTEEERAARRATFQAEQAAAAAGE